MKIKENNNSNSDISRRIRHSALLVGGFGFIAGFIGPILFSTSKLGPLLGIFITGPLGTLGGALWGIVRSAKNANTAGMKTLLKWLSAIWGLTMLYTLIMNDMSVAAIFPAIYLQGLIIVSCIFLLYNGEIYKLLTKQIKRIRSVIIITPALVILMTLFPPVTRPRWRRSKAAHESVNSTQPLPKMAYRFDSRFDSSHHVPQFTVNKRLLILEWVIVVIVALTLNQLMIWRHRRNNTGIGPPAAD
jgi:hypothetical protein